MLGHAAGSASMSGAPPVPSFPTAAPEAQGDPLGWEHPSGGPNAAPYHHFSPGEECESCCPRSPLLLPRWDRLQRAAAERRGPWWRGTTMASGTVPGEGTPACRAQQGCQGLPGCGEQRKGGTWEASAAQPRQLCCNSASGSFRFPVSVSPVCQRGWSSWMKSFVKLAQFCC